MSAIIKSYDKSKVVDLLIQIMQTCAYHRMKRVDVEATQAHFAKMRLDNRELNVTVQLQSNELGHTKVTIDCAPINLQLRESH